MAPPSPPSSSTPGKSSKPLHNFDLPPLLRWNHKDGKRSRSMKSPPPHRSHSASPLRRSPPRDLSPARPRFGSPHRDFAAGAPRFQSHMMREFRAPHPPAAAAAAEGERRDPVISDEFERLSLLQGQGEGPRHYRRRDWWSETERSDVIAYQRNPLRKTGFSPSKFSSSSSSDGRRSDAPGDYDVYRRNPLKKSPFASPPARRSWFSNPDDGRSKATATGEPDRNTFKKPTFTFTAGGEGKSNESSRPSKKYSSPSPKNPSFSSISETNPRNPFRKSGFSQPSFSNSEEKRSKDPIKKTGFSPPLMNVDDKKKSTAAEIDTNPKPTPLKKPSYSSKIKLTLSSENKKKIEEKSNLVAAKEENINDASSKEEKKSKEGEAEANPKPLKKSAFFGKLDKMKAAEAAAAAAAAAEAEAEAAKARKGKEPEEEKAKAKVTEKEMDKDAIDFDAAIKVWNLRPRNVKSKAEKSLLGGGGGEKGSSSKGKAQTQKGKAAAGKSGGGGSGGVEKKEKKKPLSINVSLTKQEIEEDIFALTGAKPSRRPRKRPKNVQKQLDTMFPGLYLLAITPETYKV